MSVGIFKNGKYNKVAGNAKDSTAANTTYNNGTSGLQANNVQSAIDELDSTVDTLNSNLQNNNTCWILYNTTFNASGETKTLLNERKFSNYKSIIIEILDYNSGTVRGNLTIPVSLFTESQSASRIIIIAYSGSYYTVAVTYKSDTTFYISSNFTSTTLKVCMYGMK